jgi:hypothetical protein
MASRLRSSDVGAQASSRCRHDLCSRLILTLSPGSDPALWASGPFDPGVRTPREHFRGGAACRRRRSHHRDPPRGLVLRHGRPTADPLQEIVERRDGADSCCSERRGAASSRISGRRALRALMTCLMHAPPLGAPRGIDWVRRYRSRHRRSASGSGRSPFGTKRDNQLTQLSGRLDP